MAGVAWFFSLYFSATCFARQFGGQPFLPQPYECAGAGSAFMLQSPHNGLVSRKICLGAVSDFPAPQSTPAPAASPKPDKPHLIELTSANWHPLTSREKRVLFERDLLHWETHVSLILDAGFSLAIGDRSYLGGGGAGLARRYGLNIADELNFTFFNVYLFPDLFHEDPRYIPLDRGSTRARLAYALSRTVVTRADSGKSEVNRSKILGTVIATSLSSSYYAATGADVSVGGTFASMGINLMSDVAFDVLKEFWPDLARKLKVNVWIRNLVRAGLRDSIRVS